VKANKYLLPILFVVALLGSVGIAQAAGWWTTSGRDVVLTDAEGQPDPAGIKGWMTLADVSTTYGVPLDLLYQQLGIPAEVSPDTALKDLEAVVPGFEIELARTVVTDYLAGTVAEPSPTAADPTPTPVATSSGAVTPATTPIKGEGDGTDADRPTPTPLPAGYILPADQIKGRMTMREVVDQCAVPLEYIYQKLGIASGEDPAQPVKDIMAKYGFEVSALQAVVAEYQSQPRP
jgi:hypothetical protein